MAREHRFFTHDIQDSSGFQKQLTFSETLESAIFWQLTKVLRVKPGDRVCLLAPVREGDSNTEFLYSVADTNKKAVVLSLADRRENHNELSFELELLLCMPNTPDKLSFILQKSVELGVKKFILVDSDNSRMAQKLRPDRLERIMTEAAEQSERAVLPHIEMSHNLKAFLEMQTTLPKKMQIYAAVERMEREGNESMNRFEIFEKMDVNNGAIVLIGPEGGFSDEEKQLIQKTCQSFSLGKRVLRMETAALLALGLFTLRSKN